MQLSASDKTKLFSVESLLNGYFSSGFSVFIVRSFRWLLVVSFNFILHRLELVPFANRKLFTSITIFNVVFRVDKILLCACSVEIISEWFSSHVSVNYFGFSLVFELFNFLFCSSLRWRISLVTHVSFDTLHNCVLLLNLSFSKYLTSNICFIQKISSLWSL